MTIEPSADGTEMQISYRLHLPRDASTVPLVRALCQDAMIRLGVRSEDVDDVGLAITEACSNVVVHAAGGVQYEVQVEYGPLTATFG